MSILINEEVKPEGNVRQLASNLALLSVLIMSAFIIFSVSRLKESRIQNRVNKKILSRHLEMFGRITMQKFLLIILFIENLGGAVIGVLTLYVTQYIVEAPEWAPLIIFRLHVSCCCLCTSMDSLSRKYGKIKLWIFSLAATGIAFGGIFIIPFLDSVTERLIMFFTGAILGGIAAGCGGAVGPSIKGDVIDYDEYLTGERKRAHTSLLRILF